MSKDCIVKEVILLEPQDIINAMVKSEGDLLSKLGTVIEEYGPGLLLIGLEGEKSKICPFASNYSPTPGDKVLLIKAAGDWVALGKVE